MTPQADDKKPVTVAECERKHRTTRNLLVLGLTFLGLLIGVGGASALSGFNSGSRLDVHEGRQEESVKHVNESLRRLEASVGAQRKMIEDLWREKNGNK